MLEARSTKQVLAALLVVLLPWSVLHSPVAFAQETTTPTEQGYRSTRQESAYTGDLADLAIAIDDFWTETLHTAGAYYTSPAVTALDRTLDTACGRRGPESGAFYCRLDQTIYMNPQFILDQEVLVGDYAPVVVLAHEWGHHIQNLLRVVNPGGNAYELQADCLAGVYTQDAEAQGLLEPGDFIEALEMSESAGDSPLFPQDAPGAHGTYIDRRNAVMRGYLDGLEGCELMHPLPPSTPTPRPQATATPRPTPTALPTPTSSLEEGPALLLTLPLAHAACFRIDADSDLTLDQLVARLGGTSEARQRLLDWGWQTSASRAFGCDSPPHGEAGWVELSIHRFATPFAAQQAVDYFATIRAEGTSLVSVAPPAVGDHAAALSGSASNGTEFTIYASSGPDLVRVTGVAPDGIPFMNVIAVTEAVLSGEQASQQSAPSVPIPSLPATAYLPISPALNYAECFGVLTQGTYSYAEIVDALGPLGVTNAQIAAMGWLDGAYVVFTCSNPPYGRATQVDVVIHHFRDADSARQALPYVDSTYVPGRNETRSCDTAGSYLVCVTGRSLTGSPLSDVHFVLSQVLSEARQ